MKTTLEWFNELPDGYRERAIANATKSGTINDPDLEPSAKSNLKCAFFWMSTSEGHDFWLAVYNHLINPKNPLPPLP